MFLDSYSSEYGECLGDWDEGPEFSEFVSYMPGVQYDRFNQCKSEFNENYLPCHTADFTVESDTETDHKASFQSYVKEYREAVGVNECLAHWCYNPANGECELSKTNPILSGTWCGVGMWCIEGQCIPNTSLSAGPQRPQCNLSSQSLTADFRVEVTTKEIVTTKLYETGDLLGRFAGVIVGAVFFIVGTLSSCLRRRRRPRGTSEAKNIPNASFNNSEFQAMMVTVPHQYHKALKKQDVPEYYDVKGYQKRIQKLFRK
ncbi:uncharacterized protein [Watersipora subatra]|uniref:uncharacterized protein n=1 Tax=Watersipora subatra TaxID=2589382 RepID=UPI00355B2EFA